MITPFRPRRSVLFMPGNNARALHKARQLDADSLIFDLEDAVAPTAKADARDQLRQALRKGGFGHRELLVRLNAWDSPWAKEDLSHFAGEDIDGLVLPKVESAQTVQAVAEQLQALRGEPLPLWAMIETPMGVLQLDAICQAHPALSALVMGTADLAKALRVDNDIERSALQHALSHCVLHARAHHLLILDGVYTHFKDEQGLKAQCLQGKAMGFDGKTLIHPKQIDLSNRCFAPSSADLAHAQQVVDVWAQAKHQQGVCVLNGQMVERLHLQEAEQLLALQKHIDARDSE